MNIYAQEKQNRRGTWFIMTLFILLVVLLGFGFDLFLTGAPPVGTIIALVVAVIWVSSSYYNGDKIVLASAGARPVNHSNLKEHQFANIVEEVKIAAGIPMPEIYIIPDPDPNAFATGRDPQHSSLAVTEGLLNTLNREELQGVVSHEMSHIRNYDIRLMMTVAALIGAVALIADWSLRAMRWSGRSRKSGAAASIFFFLIWLLMVMLAPVMAQILAMAVSRRREYLADASGAELIRNPLALSSALQKIEAAVAPTKSIKQGVAHLCIADPLGRRFTNREGFWAELFATHPPMEKRIKALNEMGYLYTKSV